MNKKEMIDIFKKHGIDLFEEDIIFNESKIIINIAEQCDKLANEIAEDINFDYFVDISDEAEIYEYIQNRVKIKDVDFDRNNIKISFDKNNEDVSNREYYYDSNSYLLRSKRGDLMKISKMWKNISDAVKEYQEKL